MDYISTVFWCNPNLVDDVNRNFHWSYPHLYLAATSLLATRTRRRWPGIRRTTCGFDDALLEASMNSWFPSQPCLIAAGYTSIPKKDVVITQWILEAPYLDKPKSSLHTCCRGSPLLQVPSDGWNGIPLPQNMRLSTLVFQRARRSWKRISRGQIWQPLLHLSFAIVELRLSLPPDSRSISSDSHVTRDQR